MIRMLAACAAIASVITWGIPSKTGDWPAQAQSATPQFNDSPALEHWLDELKLHEHCPDAGIVDSNGRLSYGPYCYQAATFKRYVRQFNLLPTTEDAELMNLIADPAIQRTLTSLIITKVPGGWQNWYTSVRKIGKPPI